MSSLKKRKTAPRFGSLDHLIAWLEEKPKNRGYNYMDPENCALGQYAREHGERYSTMPYHYSSPLKGLSRPELFERAACEANPQTFGGMLKEVKSYKRKLARA